jgi:hypothetical protein
MIAELSITTTDIQFQQQDHCTILFPTVGACLSSMFVFIYFPLLPFFSHCCFTPQTAITSLIINMNVITQDDYNPQEEFHPGLAAVTMISPPCVSALQLLKWKPSLKKRNYTKKAPSKVSRTAFRVSAHFRRSKNGSITPVTSHSRKYNGATPSSTSPTNDSHHTSTSSAQIHSDQSAARSLHIEELLSLFRAGR